MLQILGKLACGLHKPNRQTILPPAGVMDLYKTLPVRKVRNLGGKFGCVVVEQLGCKVMADLLQFTERQLQQQFHEKMGYAFQYLSKRRIYLSHGRSVIEYVHNSFMIQPG